MKSIGGKLAAVLFGTATAAWAAEGSAAGGLSPLVIGFFAFFALIIAFQAIPGLVMLVSVLRGLFSGLGHGKVPAAGVHDRDGTP